MLVIPSVDIAGGKCVQLVGGRIESARAYGDPVEWARRWQDEGAEYLHVVDLDAALSLGSNLRKVVEVIKAVDIPVQVGGGIRSLESAGSLLSAGADRIVIGTVAVENPEMLDKMIGSFGGERIVVAVDSRGGRVVVRGWQKAAGTTPIELAKMLEKKGIWGLLYTIVDVEGTMSGVQFEDVRRLVLSTSLPVLASGGVGTLQDLQRLRFAGVYGVVVGKALYELRFSLCEAMEVAR
jgi:phosphoribosylformimino-5-aminoimidazole carboxamide ribotide isomerase